MEMVSVTEILKTITGSCDFGSVDNYPGDTEDEQRTSFWTEVITTKAGDTGFGHLVDSILRKGLDPEAPIGWADARITEGHHRMVAAILLGLDFVYVTKWGDNSDKHTHPDNDSYGERFSAHRCYADPAPIAIEW
jgi:hypothetical protein